MTDPDALAAALLAARAARRPATSLPAAQRPADEAGAIAAQVALARRLGGLPPAGFKIGATARQMQALLGVSNPVAGFMPAAGLHRSGATLAWESFQKPGIECEIAVRLGRDLPPPAPGLAPDRATVAGAIAAVFAAIEVVDNRYGDVRAAGKPLMQADQFFHAAAVLGEDAPGWPGLDLAVLRGRATINGALRGEGVGADLLGHPLDCVAWLAASAEAAAFGGLRAGQVVLCGSVTLPLWLDGPAEAVIAFDRLGEVRARIA